MLAWAPVGMPLVFFAVVFSALLSLEARFTEFLEFARVVADSGSSVFYHLKYLWARQMAQPCMNQEVSFPGIQTLNDVKGEQGVVCHVVFTCVRIKSNVVITVPEH